MKKILSIITLSAGILAMSSCSDFLDQTSPSQQTDETVWNSVFYTGTRVNKLYGALGQDRTYSQDLSIVWNLNSDCELVDGLGTDAYNASSERGNMNYNQNPGWSKIEGVWTALYGIIEDANLNVQGIRNSGLLTAGGSDQKAMERYLGESLTLRAMIYFDLVKFFGDVPFKTEPTLSDLSNAYLPKTDRDEIMDALINDLEEAVDLLPWADDVTGYTTEHVTKGYVHGLIAQIALTRAGYAIRESAKSGYETASYSDQTYPTQRPDAATRKALYEKALSHLSAIITSGKHSLNPSFENHWTLINQLTLDQSYHENLFEIPLGLNLNSELGYTVGVRLSGVTSKYGYGNSTGKLKVTAPLLYSYDDNDLRRDITCSNMQIAQDGSLTKEAVLGNSPFGIYVGKWDARKMSDTWLSQNLVATAKHCTGINPVKMRYANVLLYYAEVMNELAGPDGNYNGDAGMTARQALALVHKRAFDADHQAEAQAYIDAIPNDKDPFFNAIVDENAWEFAGEGYRKWDLIRWNLLAEKIMEFKETYLRQVADGTYQQKLYFNYSDEAKTVIDYSSITWHGIPNGKSEADYAGSVSSFGGAKIDDPSDKTIYTQLPTISSGLVGDDVKVKNRYIMPIASTTISASNGTLHNSYGYSD